MDILKRSLAPITDKAWREIDIQAKRALTEKLSARKFVDVIGPKGWDYVVIGLGRLDISETQPVEDVQVGIHRVQPLVETHIAFQLEILELDNIVRGARDIELDALIKAAQKIALFEEEAIYNGFKPGNITGLAESVVHPAIPFTEKPDEFLKAISQGMTTLARASVGGPYALIINPEIWNIVANSVQGYPLKKRVKNMLGGSIIPSLNIDDAFLVSIRGGDMELIIGQDFSIGYESHDDKHVKLFLTESFTFRVLDPRVIVSLNR